jgi:hypothetical protein
MNKLNKDDLIQATLAWVIGMLMQECLPSGLYYGQFHDGDGKFKYNDFHQFSLRTHDTVYKYINGQKSLDGACSDMECHLGIKAKHIFGWYGG